MDKGGLSLYLGKGLQGFCMKLVVLLLMVFGLQVSLQANAGTEVELGLPVYSGGTASSFIVPIQVRSGLIIIDGNVNGESGNLVLDTGAKGLVLNSKYFRGQIRTDRTAFGLGGGVSALSYLRQAEVGMDEFIFEKLDADVIDMGAIEDSKKLRIIGLIGFEVLENFEVMINYKDGYLTFSEVDTHGQMIDPMPHTQLKVDSMTFKMGNFIPVLTVTINGVEKHMGLDSGAEVNLLHINNNDDIMGEFNLLRTVKITGADGRKKEALGGKLYRVKVFDKYTCAAMSTMLSNLENFHVIYRTEIDGILGFEFLAPWISSINYRKKMFYLHSFKTERP